MLNWVSRYGAHSIIASDRVPQFTSSVWKEMCEFLGARCCYTTYFHPAVNRLNECFNHSLKVALKCHDESYNWHQNLDLVLLGLRSACKDDLGCWIAEMTFGTALRFPDKYFNHSHRVDSDAFVSQYARHLSSFMSTLQCSPSRHVTARKTFMDPRLSSATHVFLRVYAVRSLLQRPYIGSHLTLERSSKHFLIERNERDERVSVDR